MFRAGSRSVGLAVLVAIVLVLAIYLVITWVVGDDTNQLEERQPSPNPESAPLIGQPVAFLMASRVRSTSEANGPAAN
jgi:amino acid transporter